MLLFQFMGKLCILENLVVVYNGLKYFNYANP